MFVASANCDFVAISGSCAENAQTSAKNVDKSGIYAHAIGDNAQHVSNATNGKVFRVSKSLALLLKMQNKLSKPKMRFGKKETIPSIPRECSRHAQLRSTRSNTTAGELQLGFNIFPTFADIQQHQSLCVIRIPDEHNARSFLFTF